MVYREPGIYLQLQNNPRYSLGSSVGLLPVIMGDGPGVLKKTISIVRSSQSFDLLQMEQVTRILSIGNFRNSDDYESATDFQLVDGNKIEWLEGETNKAPATGSVYYVTLEYVPGDEQYEPKLLFTREEVVETYGPDVDENGNINNISLGLQISIENGAIPSVGLQIKTSGAITSANYEDAFTEHLQFLPHAYRIVPMNLQADINLKVIQHVNAMSSVEERAERIALIAADHNATTAQDIVNDVGGYASGLANKRVSVIYPDRATKMLSDGIVYELGAPFLCAAIAGWKASQAVSRSYTKGQIAGFISLAGPKLTRVQKNQLAAKGVMILEQTDSGSPIEIRHGLTTDMGNIQNRELTITEIGDYVSKYLRDGLKNYIGNFNITSEFITRLKASVNSLINNLKRDNVIVDAKIEQLLQDEDNPDTVVVRISIQVPYPCNYIDIVLFLD